MRKMHKIVPYLSGFKMILKRDKNSQILEAIKLQKPTTVRMHLDCESIHSKKRRYKKYQSNSWIFLSHDRDDLHFLIESTPFMYKIDEFTN